MHTHTLFELNEHIRRVMALNFQQPWWVSAEVAQVGVSRGHHYLDLIQKSDSGEVIAQAQAAIWASDWRKLNARFPLGLQHILFEGAALRLQVRPEFHERYGLKLIVCDLDPAFTMGQLALQRQETIRQLRAEGLLEQNRRLPLPPVLQRIALISSETAAGLQDFRVHLEQNPYGYHFELHLFQSAVQGKNAASELTEALQHIAAQADRFDCVVIVRGGGARLDLLAFDDAGMCRAAAQMPLPLLCGIGHDVDESVLDLVAKLSLKTPTAVADYLLQHNLGFESAVLEATELIRYMALQRLNLAQLELERSHTLSQYAAREHLREAALRLREVQQQVPVLATALLQAQHLQLNNIEALCESLSPENVLRRGYTLVYKDGKHLASAGGAGAGEHLRVRWHDGAHEVSITAPSSKK